MTHCQNRILDCDAIHIPVWYSGHCRAILLTCLLSSLLFVASTSLGIAKESKKPDFTEGDSIPENAPHDWNLGPTGASGWMYTKDLTTLEARQIRITEVKDNTPADGKLKVGDVILGVNGEPFSHDPREELGKAITKAETEAGGGKLTLNVWREGETGTVVINLPVLGSYSKTAPYKCPKSRRILERGCKALAKEVSKKDYKKSHNAIARSLNGLALLASGDDRYLPLVKKEAQDLSEFKSDSFRPWWYGYTIMFLSEYVLATGDKSVMEGLTRLAIASAEGQSKAGSWGHGFARPTGHPNGYGMMNSAGVPLTIGLVLARKAGVDDPVVARAVKRSANLIRFYAGKGSVPYGDHNPQLKYHGTNGKNGMATVLFDLLGERRPTEFFSRMSVSSHSAERDTGHTGNFFNIAWAMPAVARSGPYATGAWMKEYGAWYYDLARRPDGLLEHQGPPNKKGDTYEDWGAHGAFLLAYAMPRREIWLTGKNGFTGPQVDPNTAKTLIRHGRGWNPKDGLSEWESLSKEKLLDLLGYWSPVVRNRAAKVLRKRKDPPVSKLVDMLKSSDDHKQLGACRAIKFIGGKAKEAAPVLRKTLHDDRLWLRVRSAQALAAIGKPAMKALPDMLKMITRGPTKDDPRNMQRRYLSSVVFEKMVRHSFEKVNRDLLYEAIRAGLETHDGRARGRVANVYNKLSFKELKPLLPSIRQAIVELAPSGIMFADGVRMEGLKLFAKYRLREGLPLLMEVMTEDRWNRHYRIKQGLKVLKKYGGAAKPILPELRKFVKTLRDDWDRKKLAGRLEDRIKQIENSTDAPELRSLEDIMK